MGNLIYGNWYVGVNHGNGLQSIVQAQPNGCFAGGINKQINPHTTFSGLVDTGQNIGLTLTFTD